MDYLPSDEIISRLSGHDLLRLCQTNLRWRHVCQDDRIWRTRVQDEYPQYSRDKPDGMTWRRYYLAAIHSSRSVMIIPSSGSIQEIPNRLLSLSYLHQHFPNASMAILRNLTLIGLITPEETIMYEDISTATLVIVMTDLGGTTMHRFALVVKLSQLGLRVSSHAPISETVTQSRIASIILATILRPINSGLLEDLYYTLDTIVVGSKN